MKRPKFTAEGVIALQPGLAGINPGAVKATPRGPRPADALASFAAPGDREVIAKVQASRRAHVRGGRRAQHLGGVNEGSVEAELDAAVSNGLVAWWRHFHPPYVRVSGEWRPRALERDEGAVDYIVQPFEGPAVLVEAKSTDGGRFALSEIPEHQRAHLDDHARAGLPAALVVTFRGEGLRAACSWERAPWRKERTARAIYADDPAVIALAVGQGDLVERLLSFARGGAS